VKLFNIFYPIPQMIATEKSKFYKKFFQKGAIFLIHLLLIIFYHILYHIANDF